MNRREMMKSVVVGAMGAAALGVGDAVAGAATESTDAPAPTPGATPSPITSPATPGPVERNDLSFWLESSLKRVFPNSPPGSGAPPAMAAARGERISFQACVRNRKTTMVRVSAAVTGADDLKPLVRRVGYVPLQGLNVDVPMDETDGVGQIPGLAPDPLYPEATANIGPEANSSFWITLTVPRDTPTGAHALAVRLTVEAEFGHVGPLATEPWSVELPATVDVRPLVVQARKDFPVTHWINIESIWDHYKIEPLGERFWELAEAYIADLTAHGVDVVYAPIFNNRHEIMPRPGQLLRVRKAGDDAWEFDFADVRRWIRMALKNGASHVEWTHFFTPAPTSGKHPQRIFESWDGRTGALLWPPETSATGDTYRAFLVQFLPLFKRVLEEEGVLGRSLFHCADEPDGDTQIADYRKARALLRELAPWMEVMDAMSDPRFATERLTDMPVPSIVTAPQFAAAKCPAWVYFCCGPRGRYLQRLLDTPLPKLRMAGWLFYRLGARGFLHWGHNYWYVFCTGTMGDPYRDPANGAWPGLPTGDPFVVYPGENGPVSSIRWEVFSESLQDYALLQSAGIKPDDPMLAPLESYEAFPKTEQWLGEARGRVLGGG